MTAHGRAAPASSPADGLAPSPGESASPADRTRPGAGGAPDSQCPNCDEPAAGAYCARCGQPADRGRLTMGKVLGRTVAAAFDLDRGLLHTALHLLLRPGLVAADYVRGITARYTNPAKYFVIVVTVAQLLAWWLGMTASFAEGLFDATDTRVGAGEAADAMNRHFILLNAAALPAVALGSLMCFRSAGFNYAEHLVFNMYITAQMIVVTSLVAAALLPLPAAVQHWLAIPVMAGSFAYYCWAAHQFFRMPVLSTMLRAAGAVLVLTVLYYVPLIFLLVYLSGGLL